MILLELFSGTQSVGKVFKEKGWEVISLDIMKKFNPTIRTDILEWEGYKELPKIDFIWASPPCNSFSTLAISNKTRDWYSLEPLKKHAELGNKILNRTLEIIKYLLDKNKDLLFVIENPFGMMYRMPIINSFNKELTYYCHYGFEWKKATHFFNNFTNGLNLNKEKITKEKQKTLKSVVKLPLKDRYSIPPKLIETIYNSYMEQYTIIPRIEYSFEYTDAMILIRPSS